jgi:hypothetical protein
LKSNSNWVLGILTLVAGLLLVSLAENWVGGLPYASEKNVTVYYPPHAESLGISLFVQPPLVTLQTQGEVQTLSLQFANHLPNPASLHGPTLSAGDCFAFYPHDASSRGRNSGSVLLQPGQAIVELYDLQAIAGKDECLSQHPLTIRYSWTSQPPPPPVVAAGKKGPPAGQGAGGGQPASPLQEAAVSTSAIQIVTANTRVLERFFHGLSLVAAAVLLPVLLALFNANYQRIQSEREIWKAVFPGILILTQQHYLPILRRIVFLKDSIEPLVKTAPNIVLKDEDVTLILERTVLFRAQTQRLVNTYGGYHFRSKPGEELYGALADAFWFSLLPYADATAYAPFSKLVEILYPKDTLIGESISLAEDTDGKKQETHKKAWESLKSRIDPATNAGRLQAMASLLSMLYAILAFECDRPLYPEWYDQAPHFRYTEFKEKAEGLLAGGFLSKEAEELRGLFEDYLDTIEKASRA